MTDTDERAWFVFQLPEAVVYVPASSEADARAALRETVCREARNLVDAWPLVGTRWTSRERLTAEQLRNANEPPETIRCRTCRGVAHPATGCVYSPTFIVCGPCTREAWFGPGGLLEHINGKGRRRGLSFYEHAGLR